MLMGMTVWICRGCGIEHPDTAAPPAHCVICSDDRQYVPGGVQEWITHDRVGPHEVTFAELEPGLTGIVVTPRIGIGHRPLLLQTPDGQILWEPSGYLDPAMVARVRAAGPLRAVAASHPHLIGAAVSWAQEFGVPLYVNAADRRWVCRPDPLIRFWEAQAELLPGVTLHRTGGHFPGSAVLHWAGGAQGRGVLLVGDTLMVAADLATVSFMRSFPNLIPLPERLVRGIQAALEPLAFDRIYGGFDRSVVNGGAKAAVAFSADRYVGWLRDEIQDPDEPL